MRRGQGFVGIDHLFEAVLDMPEKLPSAFVQKHWEGLERAGQIIARKPWPGRLPSHATEVFYTPRCGAAANEAARLARRLTNSEPAASHLLLAIMADAHARPSRTLDELGLKRGEIIEDLRSAICGGGCAPASPEAAASTPPGAEPIASGENAPAAQEAPRATATSAAANGANLLDQITRDLTLLAKQGRIEPAIGRDREVSTVMEILARRGKNNAILVGEAGVGKTKVAEGLARAIGQDKLGDDFPIKRVIELNLSALLSGTQYRGALEDKLNNLLERLKHAPDTAIFIDEVHLIMGAGGADGSNVDVANILKPALARGELRAIGATTLDEYRKFIEADPALERRFQMVRIEPLSEPASIKVLESLRPSLEKHHGVRISTRAMHAAVSLTQRYLPQRHLPDKAIDVIDQTCARWRLKKIARNGGPELERLSEPDPEQERILPHDVRKVVSQMSGVPIEEITQEERTRLTNLDRVLRKMIIGQDTAVHRAAAAAKKSRAGLGDPNRPDAVMLFLGPTGVGKTELAKALARMVYGSERHLLTFDMTEYGEAHSVSRLIGAPPGYVGSDEEGRLSKAVKDMPFSIVLFDEIEKAHPKIFDIFLPVLDEGRLKDSKGRDVNFKNTMIIFTSNIGAEILQRCESGDPRTQLMEILQEHFRPEFLNRIDEIVPFYPLLREDIFQILKIHLKALRRRIREKGLDMHVYHGAIEYLLEEGYNPDYGARELRRTVDRLIVNPVSAMLLEKKFAKGDVIEVMMEQDQLVFNRKARDTAGAEASA